MKTYRAAEKILEGLRPTGSDMTRDENSLKLQARQVIQLAESRPSPAPNAKMRSASPLRLFKTKFAVATAISLTLTGGVAVAATQGTNLFAAWSHITDRQGSFGPQGSPELLASSSGPQSVKLWAVGNQRGGDCFSIRAEGTSVDGCTDRSFDDQNGNAVLTNIAAGTAGEDFLFGKAMPGSGVTSVAVKDSDGHLISSVKVETSTSYWITGVGALDGSLVIVGLDAQGAEIPGSTANVEEDRFDPARGLTFS